MGKSKKIVLLGQFGVGKTSLVRRFIEDKFGKDYKPTLGVQICKKVISLPNGKELTMIIWDLEGFSTVEKTRGSYLLGSKAFLYVFDVSRPVTYKGLKEELTYLKEQYPDVALEVVGNKKDKMYTKELQASFIKKNIFIHSFVSAKTGEGVSDVFTHIAKQL